MQWAIFVMRLDTGHCRAVTFQPECLALDNLKFETQRSTLKQLGDGWQLKNSAYTDDYLRNPDN